MSATSPTQIGSDADWSTVVTTGVAETSRRHQDRWFAVVLGLRRSRHPGVRSHARADHLRSRLPRERDKTTARCTGVDEIPKPALVY